MPSPPPRPRLGRLGASATAAVTALVLSAAAPPPPAPLGVGDRLYPELGNPGYDVLRYDIALRYSGDNTAPLTGETTISARAEQRLEHVHLDFGRGSVGAVEVDGQSARHTTVSEDLVITPGVPIEEGGAFSITVRHTSPTTGSGRGGWVRTRDGLVIAAQPDVAHTVFPGNDHPSDKAHFTFRITVPEGTTAVAVGDATGATHAGDKVTYGYRTRYPMATELVQIAVGDMAVVTRPGPGGVTLRDVVPTGDRARLEPWLRRTPDHLDWLTDRLGAYPYSTYGVLIADTPIGFALETQTLSLYPRHVFIPGDLADWAVEGLMVHELAHHWFGNSVTPARWSDLWLSEGHATYYEWAYAAEHGGPDLLGRAREAYAASDRMRREDGPPARPHPPTGDQALEIFRPAVYDGAAVALYALRQRIGAGAFERLQREWVVRHRHSGATTADFIELAGRVAGEDLSGFLTGWLYGERTPPMPGHPRWRPDTA